MALIATAAYLLAVPVVLVGIDGWSGYDLARLLQWPVLLLAAAAAAATTSQVTHRPPQIPVVLLVALMAAAIPSVVLSPVPAMALREAAVMTGLLTLATLIARERSLHQALMGISSVAAGAYALLITGLATTVTLAGETVSRLDLFVGYDNHRFYSHVLTAAIPLTLAALHASNGRLGRHLARGSLVLLGMMLFATGGRGTMLALAGAVAFVFCRMGRRAWPTFAPLAYGMGLGAVFFALLFVWPSLADSNGGTALADYGVARLTSDQSRLPLWKHAMDLARASPWFGAGPMHFAHGHNPIAAAPHSLPLQIAAEWGLPMLALVVAIIGIVLRQLWRRLGASVDAKDPGIALSMGFVAVLLDSFVAGNFNVPMSQVWIAVLLGLFWAWLRQPYASRQLARNATGAPGAPASGQAKRFSMARAAAVSVAVLQVWLGTQMLPEAAHIGDHLRQVMKAFPTDRHQPRFWSHGRF
ncbi:MAG: O-antigen ligase family protein [Rhodoferax sp.]|nr:O-antigen ligase family protein [Rhodoferax sp.]